MYGWMYYHFLVETLPKVVLLQRHIEAEAAAGAGSNSSAAAASGSGAGGLPAAAAGSEKGVWDMLTWGQPHEARADIPCAVAQPRQASCSATEPAA